MELLQRAPPIFGWAAVTLGIGAHSSWEGYEGGNLRQLGLCLGQNEN